MLIANQWGSLRASLPAWRLVLCACPLHPRPAAALHALRLDPDPDPNQTSHRRYIGFFTVGACLNSLWGYKLFSGALKILRGDAHPTDAVTQAKEGSHSDGARPKAA